ncbi:DNA adenine methylase [Acidobacteriia bacterium AH_259_A11_L15]|nr:DNA adenine methylase [Acidobacteriia bacterium AH_259_A11_L15]
MDVIGGAAEECPAILKQSTLPFRNQSSTKFSGQPFLKWAGAKNQLLTSLREYFPEHFNRYLEPFCGGAAVFFYLRRLRGLFDAILLESNRQLINCFEAVRDHVDELLPLLAEHRQLHRKRYYYQVRQQQADQLTPLQRAARFIYLNKTCYNGLYRVNYKGEFNVPLGSYKKPRIYQQTELFAASEALARTRLLTADFSEVLDIAEKGDFVYFDPPYYMEATGFTGYALALLGQTRFGADEHRRLFEVVKSLHDRGCVVVASNSNTKYIRTLYKDFTQHVVHARRLINCDGAGRGPVSELVITNR